MAGAIIRAIATHLPAGRLSNDELAALYPDWPAQKILEKTGVRERRIAAADETASDLAFAAANRLFEIHRIQPASIDFLLFSTQAPDHHLPASACILQERLGLADSTGALDFNLGCSGYVYGLALANGLIRSGVAKRILLLTADTYSKYIHPGDKSVRTLFGDGAAATLIEMSTDDAPMKLGEFVFGTDGKGARNLIVPAGGFRLPHSPSTGQEQTDGSGNVRSADHLFMNGPEVMTFGLTRVPKLVAELIRKAAWNLPDVDHVVLHQANQFMLEALRKKLKLEPRQVPVFMEHCGNTVSSTIPFVLEDLMQRNALRPGQKMALVGFGVGYSWAGATVVA